MAEFQKPVALVSTFHVSHGEIGIQTRPVELLTGYEGNVFASTGDLVNDLRSITSVHPMLEEAVHELLAKAGAP